MKKIVTVFALLLLAFSQTNCERDDICSGTTPTTPRIVIDFYDYNQPTVLKNVTNLELQSIDSDSSVVVNGESQLLLPLKTFEDSVTFNLTLNSLSTDPTLIFTDKIQFNYARRDVYVSRACGYKTLFTLNNDPALAPGYLLNDAPAETQGTWIRNIVVDTYNIDSEDETHIRIYF
ncbi:MAG: hypothetical protein EOO50_04840 [Flavobacterium sp.]|uniref:DUF6452 family protein n=1 Tax=Flavobacterium sp. TaxID=239 RepID=UPI0011F9DEF2|nr:DUF6452 family protein [Flavobacterium sp.]RZJ67609.1 MAG: hypothetical protein EOO50_04840 [Flavobacterium sp.]